MQTAEKVSTHHKVVTLIDYFRKLKLKEVENLKISHCEIATDLHKAIEVNLAVLENPTQVSLMNYGTSFNVLTRIKRAIEQRGNN